VLNRLQDLELIVGGSSEMFWRGAFPGYGFKLDEGYASDPDDLAKLQTEIETYMHGLKRYLKLKGVSIEDMAQQIADPKSQADTMIDLIASATRIPKRILLGSERGELASSMDEKSWLATVEARRKQHCEPTIVRPFIDRLTKVGILPEPKDGYSVEWPDLMAASEKEIADIGETKTKSLKSYIESGGDEIIPPDVFMEKMLGMSDDEIEQINAKLNEIDKVVQPGDEEDMDNG